MLEVELFTTITFPVPLPVSFSTLCITVL